jgi:hypothetical protein
MKRPLSSNPLRWLTLLRDIHRNSRSLKDILGRGVPLMSNLLADWDSEFRHTHPLNVELSARTVATALSTTRYAAEQNLDALVSCGVLTPLPRQVNSHLPTTYLVSLEPIVENVENVDKLPALAAIQPVTGCYSASQISQTRMNSASAGSSPSVSPRSTYPYGTGSSTVGAQTTQIPEVFNEGGKS